MKELALVSDLIVLVGVCAFGVVSLGLVTLCERLRGGVA